MDIKKILSLLKKRWPIIVAFVIVGTLLLYIYSSLYMNKVYVAQATMIVNKSQYQVTQEDQYSYNDILLTQKLVKSYVLIMSSDANLELVQKELVLEKHPIMSIGQIRSCINIEGIDETEILKITVENTNNLLARDIANALIKVSPDTIIRTIKAGSAEVIDKASVPSTPVKPVVWQYSVIGAFIGLVLSLALVFLKDFFDNTYKTEDDIRNSLNLPVITSLPELSKDASAAILSEAPFDYRESFKVLRTKLQFSAVDGSMKKIGVTSTNPFEGKTTISVNLALTIAEAGLKVLLIDTDLRKPKIHKMLALPDAPGLTSVLTKQDELKNVLNKVTGYDTLDVITCGVIPPNPAELLGSHQMEAFMDSVVDEYDYIIFDTPPVSLVADTAVLSKNLDGIVWVVSYGKTVIEAAQFAKQTMDSVGANIIGCVFNSVKTDSYGNRGYYKRYGKRFGFKKSSRYGYKNKYGYGESRYGYGNKY